MDLFRSVPVPETCTIYADLFLFPDAFGTLLQAQLSPIMEAVPVQEPVSDCIELLATGSP